MGTFGIGNSSNTEDTMKSIFYQTLSNGQNVNVIDIGTDAKYAHDCFDGSDQEWEELISGIENPKNPTFFIVSLAMSGCMADSVSVYINREDALEGAKFWIEQDEEMVAEESE